MKSAHARKRRQNDAFPLITLVWIEINLQEERIESFGLRRLENAQEKRNEFSRQKDGSQLSNL